ncbi:D-alanine--poly(phosphoribitol) ligase subunit DltA [Pediococcus parvulus]|uniref:D-alanine--poly(phosphoribitol) ligase subunit DltA n=2 Tax=Pediococcus parvulus TaxID=54062 RepID=UPI00070DEE16|nr:D-alanine--poly(phosphoribitol) ligase subunit DltA [Pediococcus parvulus]MCT3027532.1 D-alanine--poly(phosphoribitol) ligase subunit 1 [Pediococcus parvulus]GEL89630.1 D-alanine--poly(phosphoribitol) ligase subunit 1 [Pediococcus parvulus]
MKITNVIQVIDQVAQTAPDRVAYDYLGETHTYQELKSYSDALANQIAQMKLEPQAPIMVYGEQTFEMIASFLGCVKSGHAYIPIDEHSPNDRLTMIQEIAKPAACIAIEQLPIEINKIPVIRSEKLAQIFRRTELKETWTPVVGNQNFYIIFTSGTTGKPKGVQISHQNLLSFVNWMLSDFNLQNKPAFLAQAPYSFDLSVMSLYPTLVSGGTLKVLPKKITDDFKRLFSYLPKMKLNVWVSTPSFVDICLLEPSFDAKHLPDLSHFLFCGEELTHKTAAQLNQRFPEARVFNTYGPTETTVAVTAVQITPKILTNYDRLPIGQAKVDTKIEIMSSNGKVLPNGEEGEIVISGPGVSKGYLNNPRKTVNAFHCEGNLNTYHSGDLGKKDKSGMIRYLGRLDFQIKLHGYRIELEEVNHFLNAQKLIKQAVVVPKYDLNHKVSQLVAYVTLQKKSLEETNMALTMAIKKDLQKTMMPYMVPNRFVFKDKLPLTANGKVDIKSIMSEVNS